MKNCDKLLEHDYPEKLSTLKFSNKQRLYDLYDAPERASSAHNVLVTRAAAAALVLAFGVTAVASGSAVYNSLSDRTAVLEGEEATQAAADEQTDDYDPEAIEEEFIVLDETDDAVEIIPDLSNSYKENKYGEIYGPYYPGNDVDLVGVSFVDYASGNDSGEVGYCYLLDFIEVGDDSEPVECVDENGNTVTGYRERETPLNRNWIYIYNEDGDEILGKWFLNEGGFNGKSNAALENPEIAAWLSTDEEANAVYEERVAARFEAKGLSYPE